MGQVSVVWMRASQIQSMHSPYDTTLITVFLIYLHLS